MQYCWNAGGYLAEFEYLDEEQALDSVLLVDKHFWIGLSDFAHEGTWRWQESHGETSYQNWCSGQPDNGGGDEDCVAKICSADANCKWNDCQCSDNDYAHALCQMSNGEMK